MRLLPSNDPNSKNMTLSEHLEELRRTVIKALLALLGGVILGYFLHPYVWEIVCIPFRSVMFDIQEAGFDQETRPILSMELLRQAIVRSATK